MNVFSHLHSASVEESTSHLPLLLQLTLVHGFSVTAMKDGGLLVSDDGKEEGDKDGSEEGISDGIIEGSEEGISDGIIDRSEDGASVDVHFSSVLVAAPSSQQSIVATKVPGNVDSLPQYSHDLVSLHSLSGT